MKHMLFSHSQRPYHTLLPPTTETLSQLPFIIILQATESKLIYVAYWPRHANVSVTTGLVKKLREATLYVETFYD